MATKPSALRKFVGFTWLQQTLNQLFVRVNQATEKWYPLNWVQVAVSGSKTLSDADHMTIQVVSANATLTVPAGLRDDFICKMFYTSGSGQILVAASSTTIRTLTTLEVSTQYGEATLTAYGSDLYYIKGDLDAT